MDTLESLNHSVWDCKDHVVFIPKYRRPRRKALCAELRRHLGEAFKKLAAQKESRIEEGHLHQEVVPHGAALASPPAASSGSHSNAPGRRPCGVPPELDPKTGGGKVAEVIDKHSRT